MIPVARKVLKPEPPDFDVKCRKAGQAWLLANPKGVRKAKRPKDLWSPFRTTLAQAFGDLCAYGAMYEPNGTVDHFQSVHSDEKLAYEWSNYRYLTGWINSSKNKRPDVLDVFHVKTGWFEVLLPSLQLVAIEANIPARHRAKARKTVIDLHLRDDERILKQRREWLRMYEDGELNFEGLRKKAPLIAAAVEKRDGALATKATVSP